MFAISKAVVYPGYGVAIIAREIEKTIGVQLIKLYELKFLHRDVTILVPVDGVATVGIRDVSSPEAVKIIFEVFSSRIDHEHLSEAMSNSWNRRSKEYQNRIRTGSLKELAFIYREIKAIERQKALSFGEKSVLAQVECLMAEECALVEDRPIEEVLVELRSCCEACLSGLSHTVSSFLSQPVHTFGPLSAEDKRNSTLKER